MFFNYLKVLFSVEGNWFGPHFSVLFVNLVSGKNDRDILTNMNYFSVPVGYILVRFSGSYVKHDDSTLTLSVVSVTKSAKLLLTCSVPDIELDGSTGCVEHQGMDFSTQGGHVFLLKLASQVTFYKGGLSSTSITNEDQFEGGHVLTRSSLCFYKKMRKKSWN